MHCVTIDDAVGPALQKPSPLGVPSAVPISHRRLNTGLSTHLTLVHARGGCRVVPILTPGGGVEVGYKSSLVKGDGGIESHFPYRTPIPEGTPLKNPQAAS